MNALDAQTTTLEGFEQYGQIVGMVRMAVYESTANLLKEFDQKIREKDGIIETLSERMRDMEEQHQKILEQVEASRKTELIGRESEINSAMVTKYESIDYEELRLMLDRNAKQAARAKGTHVRQIRNYIYNRLEELTGFNVYEVGAESFYNKERNINRGPSLVNTLIKHGRIAEAVVISEHVK